MLDQSTTEGAIRCAMWPLSSDDNICVHECVGVIAVEEKVKSERKLRIGTWNFAGLCSERKQKEVGRSVSWVLL